MGRLTLTSRGEANRAQHQADGVRLQAAINRGGKAARAADSAALEPPPVPEPPPAAAVAADAPAPPPLVAVEVAGAATMTDAGVQLAVAHRPVRKGARKGLPPGEGH